MAAFAVLFDMLPSTSLPQMVNTEFQMTFFSVKNIDDYVAESSKVILKVKN